MKTITIARIYLHEGDQLLNKITNHLKEDENIRGMTVFRAISGFGDSGIHQASIVDLSLDLPITVEFFATPDIMENAINELSQWVKPGHLVCWDAKTNGD